jgi:hypothetical protein
LTDTTEASARHWLLDAALGAGAALVAITVAHAALPERAAPAARPAIAPLAQAVAQQAARPAALIAFADPVPGREVVSPFGLRQLPWEENGRLHEGVDIAAPLGSPVLAAADGVVAAAGRSDSYGRFVRIVHAEGLTSLYAHMGAIADEMFPGREISAGTPVGKIGSSGTSTGPHLHFELRDEKDRPLNPDLFLGHAVASAGDLPLKQARRFPRGVRIAYVSMIPKAKQALMDAKFERAARSAADAAGNASVTVFYGDGRPHARFRVRSYREPAAPAPTSSDAPIPATAAPESPPA